MQPAIILLVFINDCKAFAYFQLPFLSHDPEHLCKRKKTKTILYLLWCPRGKCFFFCLLYHLNFAVLSLAMQDWKPAVVFSPFCSTIRNYKGYGFLTKYRRTRDTWIELKWELVFKKKGIDVEHLDGSFTKYFSGYRNVLMTEGSLSLPRPATCSVLLSPLYQQVYCVKLPKIHPSKHQMQAITTAFGRLVQECEEGRKYLFA